MVGKTDARLDKAFLALTPRERAIHVLQALREERELEPQVRRTMPWWQREEYDHYLGLLRAANFHLAYYVIILEQHASQLRDRFGWWLTAKAWEMGKPPKRIKRMPSPTQTARVLEKSLREGIRYRWQQVMAVEANLLGMAEQFSGEDPLRPFLRDFLDRARQTLEELREKVQSVGKPLELPEPWEEQVEEVVQFVLRVKDLR